MNTVKNHTNPFAVKLDRCDGCCSILNGSSSKVCFLNKTADLNLSVSNMITGINECLCKCKFDGRKYNSNQKCYNDKFWWECKKHHICEKSYTWNPATFSCKNGKYLASNLHNSEITYDEVIEVEERKTIP